MLPHRLTVLLSELKPIIARGTYENLDACLFINLRMLLELLVRLTALTRPTRPKLL